MKAERNDLTHAVLFDIDNTLILFDETRFLKTYIPKIARYFSDYMDEAVFTRRLLESTQAMLMNNGKTTNSRFFLERFTGKSFDKNIWDRFIEFYRNEFDSFASLVKPTPDVLDVFRTIETWPLKIIIASNPVWPIMVHGKRSGQRHDRGKYRNENLSCQRQCSAPDRSPDNEPKNRYTGSTGFSNAEFSGNS